MTIMPSTSGRVFDVAREGKRVHLVGGHERSVDLDPREAAIGPVHGFFDHFVECLTRLAEQTKPKRIRPLVAFPGELFQRQHDLGPGFLFHAGAIVENAIHGGGPNPRQLGDLLNRGSFPAAGP